MTQSQNILETKKYFPYRARNATSPKNLIIMLSC